jgi:transcriptional regulator with XRE-family HTH domain
MTPHTLSSLSGQELAALRRGAGLTQVQLAQTAGIGRHAVSYWESRAKVNPWSWAPKRMLDVLGVKVVPHSNTTTRTGAGARHGASTWMDGHVAELIAREEARLLAKREAKRARRAIRLDAIRGLVAARKATAQARERVPCGACTRKGELCRMRSEPGRRRCRHHGGMSTGPKTPEGRARIAEAERRRWQQWRLRSSEALIC